jgi:DNA invertase Pin-like site-specific DNA recombinase
MICAAIYARKSTPQPGVCDEAKSITRQVDHARAYAARKGWTVSDEFIYVDDDITGAEFAKRPGFLRLMNALKPRPLFQTLIMSEESRLGREQIETAYALKQLVTAGVRVFLYLEDRERTLDSPVEKIMLSLTAFADELEREKARQRTYDAMVRKARAGHVAGGRVFGYSNLRTVQGHVVRVIEDREATVVRRIFERCAAGYGMKQIAHALNAERAPCPRPQQGRPSGWAPSTVREILYRPLYRGELVWNRTRKRDQWGRAHQRARPEAEWLRTAAPELRIVSDEAWDAAHARLAEARGLYLKATNGTPWGRPPRGTESKYLLVGLARCACGAGVSVRSRRHGHRRAFYYVCTAYHLRGRAVCRNHYELPMDATNRAVLTAIREQVLSPALINTVISRALDKLYVEKQVENQRRDLTAELRRVNEELARLTNALAGGADFTSIVEALRERETRKRTLEIQLACARALEALPDLDRAGVEQRLRRRLADWDVPLLEDVPRARQLLRTVLVGRLTVTPDRSTPDRSATIEGTTSLRELVSEALPKGMASPTGFEPVFWP